MVWILPTLIFLVFCVSHSFLAENWVKKSIFNRYPNFQPYYRISYSFFIVTIVDFMGLGCAFPNFELYKLSSFYGIFFFGIKIVAFALFLSVLFKFDVGTFAGTKQVRAYLKTGKFPDYMDETKKGKLITTGIQKYVRHPLYSLAILFMLADPSPSNSYVYTVTCITFYFWVGSYYEERKLIERFGKDYVKYQSKTGRFFPNLLKLIK